jgi:predicted transcriptional regulator
MQVLIDLEPDMLRRIEQIAPARSRKRSAFIRAAIQKALWELEEQKTRRAYEAEPDREPVAFDPEAWEPIPYGGFDPPRRARPRRRRTARARR